MNLFWGPVPRVSPGLLLERTRYTNTFEHAGDVSVSSYRRFSSFGVMYVHLVVIMFDTLLHLLGCTSIGGCERLVPC